MIDEFGTPVQTATTVFANTANNVSGVLALACAATDTSLTLTPGGGALFPNAPFYCSCEFEVMWCIAKSGDALVVQRGVDGTTATAHQVAQLVEMRNNAGLWNDLANAINATEQGVQSGTMLPSDLAYVDKTQEFTNKTIDLTDSAKGNVIIGTVQPDPAALVYENLLFNGGFEDWFFAPSTSIPAGSPTSGLHQSTFCNGWIMFTENDSSMTCTQDTNFPDFESSVDCQINVSTVQANDVCAVEQAFDYTNFPLNDLNKWRNQPVSISARCSLVSGNVQMNFSLSAGYPSGPPDAINSPWVPVTNGFNTYKFENQTIPTQINPNGVYILIQFKGVGVVRLDNVMMSLSPVATNYRPKMLRWLTGVPNKLTNGGFEVSQRGTSFNANGVTLDRWTLAASGPGIGVGVNQTPTATMPSSHYYTFLGITLPAAPSPSGMSLIQKLEAADYGALFGQTITLSGFAFQPASDTGDFTIRISVTSNSLGVIYSRGYIPPRDNSWHQFVTSIFIPGDTTQIQVEIAFNGPIAPNVVAQIGLDNFQLVAGFVPAQFNPMNYGDELTQCQRYYEQMLIPGSTCIFLGAGSAGNTIGCYLPYNTPKGGYPTFTFQATQWVLTRPDTGVASSATNPATWGTGLNGFGLYATGSEGNGVVTSFSPQGSTGTFTFEWNP